MLVMIYLQLDDRSGGQRRLSCLGIAPKVQLFMKSVWLDPLHATIVRFHMRIANVVMLTPETVGLFDV